MGESGTAARAGDARAASDGLIARDVLIRCRSPHAMVLSEKARGNAPTVSRQQADQRANVIAYLKHFDASGNKN